MGLVVYLDDQTQPHVFFMFVTCVVSCLVSCLAGLMFGFMFDVWFDVLVWCVVSCLVSCLAGLMFGFMFDVRFDFWFGVWFHVGFMFIVPCFSFSPSRNLKFWVL